MTTKYVSFDLVKDRVRSAEDVEIRAMAGGKRIPFEALVRLLQVHIKTVPDFAFRFLGSGRSNSEVILLVQGSGRPRVIKCGPYDEIERERRAKRHRGQASP